MANKKNALQPTDIPDELKSKNERAQQVIQKYALFGTGSALLPNAFLNIAALTGIQVKMINDIGRIYGVDMDEHLTRTITSTAISSLGGRIVAGGVTRLLRFMSPLKFLFGGMTSAALSGFMTAETGEVYRQHFAAGGDPADITFQEIVNRIQTQIRTGNFNPSTYGLKSGMRLLRGRNSNND